MSTTWISISWSWPKVTLPSYETSHLCTSPSFLVLVLIVTAMWQSKSGLDPGKIKPEKKMFIFQPGSNPWSVCFHQDSRQKYNSCWERYQVNLNVKLQLKEQKVILVIKALKLVEIVKWKHIYIYIVTVKCLNLLWGIWCFPLDKRTKQLPF